MLTFRKITDADREAVAALGASAATMQNADIAFLACDGGETLAYIFVELAGTEAVLHRIYVVPSARRGKIGTMLYRCAERAARERGYATMQLASPPDDGAEEFFRRMGFDGNEKDITIENFERECESRA